MLPEAFVPGFPDWIWNVSFGQMGLHQRLYAKLLEESVTIGSEATDQLCEAARESDVYVTIGISERNSEASGGSLYNTQLYIDSMPLVRYSLYAQGVELYLAPTYDEGDVWQASMRHIAKEGRTYVMSYCMVSRKEDIIAKVPELALYYESSGEWVNTGNSIIVDPNGEIIVGPLHKEEGVLYAQMDLELLRGSKWNLDVAGHYARPDAFELTIRRDPTPMVRIKENRVAKDEGEEGLLS